MDSKVLPIPTSEKLSSAASWAVSASPNSEVTASPSAPAINVIATTSANTAAGSLASAASVAKKIISNVEKVIVGKSYVAFFATMTLLCQGHLLLEDPPGVGKTVLAKALARTLGGTFCRIHCTPDLLPADILGVNIFERKSGQFVFHPGPVFSDVMLADEINRATPKTQSALLECMEERQVTTDGLTRPLPQPFLVIATQNPIEFEGTFRLPEAQLDRFMTRLSLGYPEASAESKMLEMQQQSHPLEALTQVVTLEELQQAGREIRQVHVEESLRNYIVEIVQATRREEVMLGASPRGSQALFRLSQACAAVQNRNFVTADDIHLAAVPTLAHRLITMSMAREESEAIVKRVLTKIVVPA